MKSYTRTAVTVLMLMGLFAAGTAFSHDVVIPPWRGELGSTFQEWRFDTAANPPVADNVINTFGSPQAVITFGYPNEGYFPTWSHSTNTGFWDLGPGGTMAFTIPNETAAGAPSCKFIWVQVAQYYGGPIQAYCTVSMPGAVNQGGQRVVYERPYPGFGTFTVDQTMWRLEPSPASETVTITALGNTLVDQVVIDTWTVAYPQITVQPVSQTNVAGATVIFNVSAAGTGSLAYQWKKGTQILNDETNAVLVLSDILLEDAGIYTVEVSNVGGSAVSDPAALTVVAQPMLTIDSYLSGNATLSLTATSGHKYGIQASTDFSFWLNLCTNLAPYTFVDTNAGSFPHRFYRGFFVP